MNHAGFAKMAADLDSNPKVRRAGRNGREVFLFVLRRNAMGDGSGGIPLSYVDPTYLAEQLMVTESDASDGVSRAVTAGLLVQDDVAGVIRVVGWSDEWSRRAKTGAQRQAALRARKKANTPGEVTARDASDVTQRHGDGCDVLEERRGDQIIEREARFAESSAIREPVTPEPKPKRASRRSRAVPLPADWEPGDQVVIPIGIDMHLELEKFRNHAIANDRRQVDWDASWRNWLLTARPKSNYVPPGSPTDEIRKIPTWR
jgi:hypothetical protein